jgi:hypothetical protein
VARSATDRRFPKLINMIVPLPVRLGKIMRYHQTFEAHGQKRPLTHRFILATWLQGNGKQQNS